MTAREIPPVPTSPETLEAWIAFLRTATPLERQCAKIKLNSVWPNSPPITASLKVMHDNPRLMESLTQTGQESLRLLFAGESLSEFYRDNPLEPLPDTDSVMGTLPPLEGLPTLTEPKDAG
jgi:hypothetical protein